MEDHRLTRRQVLAGTAAAAAFTVVPRHVLGGPGHTPPSEKLNIAGIGIGGMGAANLGALESQSIVALCDVDRAYAAHTVARYPSAKFYTDYRELLAQQKDLDAVVIATPDHTHAVISMAALKAGKHVYCQKPLTHDVNEARMLAKAAAGTRMATQMGIQGHSGDGVRKTCEMIWDGAIGEVREVDAYCSLSYYPWGHAGWSSKLSARPTETPAVPDSLNWDLWLGPAPERPYHPVYHPQTWRAWWDFGCGMMGDRGAHTLDGVFWALKLGAPSSVDAVSCGLNPDTHPVSSVITFRFPARQGMPPLKLTWYEGIRAPRPEAMDADMPLPDEGGAIFKGTKGIIVANVYSGDPWLFPEKLRRAYKPPKETLPRVRESHEMDWVRAAKTGGQAGAHFGYSGPLTEMCLLGNVAKKVDGTVEWDGAAMKVTNRADADRLVRPERRKGWEL